MHYLSLDSEPILEQTIGLFRIHGVQVGAKMVSQRLSAVKISAVLLAVPRTLLIFKILQKNGSEIFHFIFMISTRLVLCV
jgi:hypothetical protein